MPRDARVYRKTFPRQTTRYVGWELNLTYPPQDQRIDYEIEAVFYRSDGSVFARQTAEAYVDEGWTTSSPSRGRGWSQPLQWKTGSYRVDLSVEGEVIASEEFEIINSKIPTSGPFLELQSKLPWATYPLDLDDEKALIALSGMMETDPTLAASVASLPWVRQALTGEGRGALQVLDMLATEDVDLAKRSLASHGWPMTLPRTSGWL